MSTEEEIYEVFCQDIEKKTRIVLNKSGLAPFIEDEGGRPLRIFELGEGCGAEKIVCSDFRPREKKSKTLRESKN